MGTNPTLGPTDRLAILELLARYGHLVDARDWEGLGALFTDKGVIDATVYGVDPVVGREAVVAFYAGARHPAAHHSTNAVIEVNEGTVRVHSKWLVGYPDGRTAGGDYHDEVVAEGADWRFALRRITRRWPEDSGASVGAPAT